MSDEDLRVRIVGRHPHAGATGTIRFTDGKANVLASSVLDGAAMYRVEIDDDERHSGQACYAEKADMEVWRNGRWCPYVGERRSIVTG